MKMLAHRGWWLHAGEKNTMAAFERAREHGFGLETDVRDRGGALVISHDPPRGGEPRLEQVLELYRGSDLTLAINVKADGLAVEVQALLDAYRVRWFAFDMSGPETLRYLRLGAPTYTRHSDIEPQPLCYDEALGVWLDGMHRDWHDAAVVQAHLARGKQVCLVSPELHGRDPAPVWAWLAGPALAGRDDLYVCTDQPLQLQQRLQTLEEETP